MTATPGLTHHGDPPPRGPLRCAFFRYAPAATRLVNNGVISGVTGGIAVLDGRRSTGHRGRRLTARSGCVDVVFASQRGGHRYSPELQGSSPKRLALTGWRWRRVAEVPGQIPGRSRTGGRVEPGAERWPKLKLGEFNRSSRWCSTGPQRNQAGAVGAGRHRGDSNSRSGAAGRVAMPLNYLAARHQLVEPSVPGGAGPKPDATETPPSAECPAAQIRYQTALHQRLQSAARRLQEQCDPSANKGQAQRTGYPQSTPGWPAQPQIVAGAIDKRLQGGGYKRGPFRASRLGRTNPPPGESGALATVNHSTSAALKENSQRRRASHAAYSASSTPKAIRGRASVNEL